MLFVALRLAENAGGTMMAAGLTSLMVFLGATAFWVWSIVDAAKRPEAQWDAAGQNKMVWLVSIVVLGALASAVYVMVARSSLKRIEMAANASFDPTAFGVPQGGMTYDRDGFVHQSR
jgi:cellobiose-specific phosphotransferase system component IIC